MSRNVEVTLEEIGERAIKVQITRGMLKRAPLCEIQRDIGKHMAPCFTYAPGNHEWCASCEARNDAWNRANLASKSLSSGITSYRTRAKRRG